MPQLRSNRWFWTALLVGVVAAAGRALAFSGTELYADEAYYWLWSLRPAAGYFDHPPLVAWLIRAGAPLMGGELGVRLLFLACGALSVLFAALLARELSGDPRAPVWAALLAASAPLLNVIGALALPDSPLVAAYTAALWLIARAHGPRWAAAGLAVGIALLAKFTAGLLAPALLILVAWDAELRRELRTPWPWIGALVAVAVFSPCLAWNAGRDWIALRFQLGHGFALNATAGSFLEYVAGQLGGAGPVAMVLGVALLVRARTPAEKRTAAGALLPLVVTTWSALRGRVEANWPALAYPALAAAAAAWLARTPRRALARAVVLASTAATVLLLVGFGVEQRHPRMLAGTAVVERFHGWKALAADVRALARGACREVGCDPEQPFLVSANYQYASELAYYGGFRRIGPAIERPSQLDVWDERPRLGEPFLFIGMAGAGEEFRRAIRADGEGTTVRATIIHAGERLRVVTVTPFARYAGDLLRR